MSFIKGFVLSVVVLFAIVGGLGLSKKAKLKNANVAVQEAVEEKSPQETAAYLAEAEKAYITAPIKSEKAPAKVEKVVAKIEAAPPAHIDSLDMADYDKTNQVQRFFTLGKNKFPFVETISYKSKVPWLQGRPAWIADYASHYSTSRHFIARSLNAKADYYTQKVASGDQFNVFSLDTNLEFHLVVDLEQHMMWFYAHDVDKDKRYFIRTYPIACGKEDATSPSGCLSPVGTFKLGEKVAIYKPDVEGFFKDTKVEMVTVFGTRWIPYSGEDDYSLASIKGYGIHGAPWQRNEKTGELQEVKDAIGKNVSSGCIWLHQDDIEELFSIVITKPTTIQIVKKFQDAKLPGVEIQDLASASAN